jgi:very-short-patch-repair endonuclease
MTAPNSGGHARRARHLLSLDQVLSRQYGVISLSQATRFGITMSAVRYRSRPGGSWQRIFPGVYLTVSGTPTVDQLDIAALLYGGRNATLTGLAALRRLGYRFQSTRFVDVLVPVSCGRRSRDYVRIIRTAQFPRLVLVEGEMQSVMVPRAVVDATMAMRDIRDVRALVAGAVQQRACKVQDLRAEIANRRLRDAGRFRTVLAEVGDGVRSSPEGDLMDLIRRGRLPTPYYNPRLYLDGKFLCSPDVWWPQVGLAVEVDSQEWHLSPQDWQQTMERHARMAAAGIRVLHFSPSQILTQSAEVIATIRRALAVGSSVPQITTRAADI